MQFSKMKRCIVLLLCIVLAFEGMSIQAFASGNSQITKGNSSSNKTQGVYVMRAPENMEGEAVNEWPNSSFWGQLSVPRKNIKRVEFHDTMNDAPKNRYDFSEKHDKTVIGWIEKDVLHVAANGSIRLNRDSSWMFAGFTNLESIDFNGCVDTVGVEDMNHMFIDCKKLEELDVSCFDTKKVKNMKAMFYNCKALEELDVSGFDTSSVKNMCKMFAYCENVEEIDVSGFNTSKVTDMSHMFNRCKSLTYLDLSSFQTKKVTQFNSMFYQCERLEELDISGFDTSSALGMSYMFGGCTRLRRVSINRRNFDTSKVIGYAGFLDGNWTTEDGKSWVELF